MFDFKMFFLKSIVLSVVSNVLLGFEPLYSNVYNIATTYNMSTDCIMLTFYLLKYFKKHNGSIFYLN